MEGGEGVEGFRVVTAVGEKRVGRIVGAEGHYYIVRRSFGRSRYPAAQASSPRLILSNGGC